MSRPTKRQSKWEIESTKRLRAEDEVRKLLRAVEQSSNTIVITDTNGNIEYANPRTMQLTGYAPEEIIGKNPRVFKSSATSPDVYRELWETIKAGREWRGEMLNRKKNGDLYWEYACISPIKNEQGEVTHFLGVKEDITERKMAEEALLLAREELETRVEERTLDLRLANEELRTEVVERRRAERELDRFFALSLDILCIAGIDGYFKRVNLAFEKTLGYTREELLASPFIEFVHADDRETTIAEVQKLASGMPVIHFENRYRCKDGSYRWLAWTAAPETTTGSIYAVARDTTDLKQAEAEIQKLNEELEHRVAERTTELQFANKELEAFAFSVSHDLRAPLRHIDGLSQALVEDYADKLDETGTHYLNSLRSESQRMAQLIDDLLRLSRVTRAEMRRIEVDLSAMVGSIIEKLRKDEPVRAVEFAVAPGVRVNGDPNLLRLVVENLLLNAWKYTSKRADASIEFGVMWQDGNRAFYVRDNGVGFDMNYADKLFAPFQRLHGADEFPGTGIGLATVQRIIHRHGGRVWAEAAVDQGATFYFTLA